MTLFRNVVQGKERGRSRAIKWWGDARKRRAAESVPLRRSRSTLFVTRSVLSTERRIYIRLLFDDAQKHISLYKRKGYSGMGFPFVVARFGAEWEWRIKFPRISRVFCGIPLPLATPARHVHLHE